MSGQRVLVVDDEPQILRGLQTMLRGAGYDVATAATAADALAAAAAHPPEAVILDLILPDGRGTDVARELRKWTDAPVIVLSARGEERDKVEALDDGADDYLAKPFDFPELVARCRALGRRATPAAPPLLVAGDVALDPARRIVRRADRPVELTRKEFGVLEVLLGAGGAVVSSEELLERVWDENADPFTTTVRVTVMTLRKKLGEPALIETVVGAGYRVPTAG